MLNKRFLIFKERGYLFLVLRRLKGLSNPGFCLQKENVSDLVPLSLPIPSMASTYIYTTEQPKTRAHWMIYEQTCFTHSMCTRSFSSTSHGRSNARTCTHICVFHGKGSFGRHSCSQRQTTRRYPSNVGQIPTSLHSRDETRLSRIIAWKSKKKLFWQIVASAVHLISFIRFSHLAQSDKKWWIVETRIKTAGNNLKGVGKKLFVWRREKIRGLALLPRLVFLIELHFTLIPC